MAQTCNHINLTCPTTDCFRWYSPSLIIPSRTTITNISKQQGPAQPVMLPIDLYLRQRCLTEVVLRHHYQRGYNLPGRGRRTKRWLHSNHESDGGDLKPAQYHLSRTCQRNIAPRGAAIQSSGDPNRHVGRRNRGDCAWNICGVGAECDIVCRPASEESGGAGDTGVRGGGSGALCSRAGTAARAGEQGTGEDGINVRNIALSLVSLCSLELNPSVRFGISKSPDLMPTSLLGLAPKYYICRLLSW